MRSQKQNQYQSQNQPQRRRTGVSDPHGHSLRELDSVGFAEQMPRFAVGVVEMAPAQALRLEQQHCQSKNVSQRKNEPRILGDYVNSDKIDFRKLVSGIASPFDRPLNCNLMHSVQHMGGGLDLNANQPRTSTVVERVGM